MRTLKVGLAAALVLTIALAAAAIAQEKETTEAAKATETKAPAAPKEAAVPKEPAAPKAPAPPKEPAAAKEAAPTKLGSKSIVGEVIDPACWVINGAKGEAHKECTIACAKAGQTLAILERKTNKIYILATEKPGEDPNKAVIDFAGQTVLVKGRVFARGGLTAIQVASVEPYTAKTASR